MTEYERLQDEPNEIDWDFYAGSDEDFWERMDSRASRVKKPGDIELGYQAGTKTPVYLPSTTFRRHMYVVGEHGYGKTKFLESLMEQQIEQGSGFGVIDCTGDLVQHIKGFIACAHHRTGSQELFDRVVLIDPTHPTLTATFNPLEALPNTSPETQAAELVSVFHKMWSDSWGPRMQDVMMNSFTALGEAGLTLLDLRSFLRDDRFRAAVLQQVSHPDVLEYFEDEFNKYSPSERRSVLAPVRNKMRLFLYDRRVRQMLATPKSSFNFRDVMDHSKILLINLDEGQLGSAAWLLSALFMAKIKMAAQSRSDIKIETQRALFHLYVDEFANYATDEFGYVLAQARKFGLSIVMAHQNLAQISSSLRGIILGNAQARICFRVNASDSAIMAREFFRYSQDQVKRERPLKSGDISYTYRSSGEQRELMAESIHYLPERFCYVNDKGAQDVVRIQTRDVDSPAKVLGLSDEEALEYIDSLPIGRKYLVERSSIDQQETTQPIATSPETPSEGDLLNAKELAFLQFIADNSKMPATKVYKAITVGIWKGNQIRDALLAKAFIEEQETRLGQKGRPAKIFIPTFKALELLGKERPKGRGETIHRHVQQLIETEGLAKGYRVQIEKPLQNGGAVDVHLENRAEQIGIEVAIASRPDREITHIRNCLDAGYDRIFSLFADENKLARTEERLKDSFTQAELSKVTLLPVWKIGSFL